MSFVQLWPPELDRCAADAPVWWAFELVSAQSTERKQHGEKRRGTNKTFTRPGSEVSFFRSHRNALWIPRLASRPPLPRHLLIWQEAKGRRDVNDTFASSAASVLAVLAASPLKRRRVRCLSRRPCWRTNNDRLVRIPVDFSSRGGHRAERSLDRPSRVPQKWHFSWFPTHFPLLCCSRLSLLPHPASHWAPIFIPPLSPALVKQTGCCLPCGSLSFFFFFPPSDPLVIHFRGRQPYSSRRMQPARFICRCLSARRWPLTASDGAATAVGHIQPELYTHCRWIMPSVSK